MCIYCYVIAESKPEEFKDKYLGALIWTTRLGNAAKLGIQVVMRQPSNFYKATPVSCSYLKYIRYVFGMYSIHIRYIFEMCSNILEVKYELQY